MTFRALSRSLLAVLFVISGRAQIEIRGSRLYVNGEGFTVRGVAYSPTPIGATPGASWQVSGCLYGRDLPLMARAGINTVRVYGRIPAGETTFWQALTKSNLYLLAGFPLEPYHDPRASLAPGSDLRARILRDFREYAEQLRETRRVLAVVFGNEVASGYSRKFGGTARDFYGLVAEAAAGSPLPVTTAVTDVAELSDAPGVAFWSLNAVRGITFEGLFEEARRRTTRPLLISEFGVDAWDHNRGVEEAETQASALRNLVRLLQQEAVLGGVWFEWSDEWWRGGADPSRHATAGEPRPGFPDGVANGGWFGLFGLTATDAGGLDALRPRAAFAAMAEEWGGRLPAEWPAMKPPRLASPGAVNAASLQPIVAPGSLFSFFGEDLADAPWRPSEAALPLYADLTTACLASRPAPLLSLDSTQINGQVPWETPIGPASALVYRAGAASNVVPLEVREIAPGILERGVLEAGRPCPVSVANGVRPGAYLEVYGTGLGGVSLPLPNGVASALPRSTDVLPRALLGSRELRVLYSGLVPGVVGLYQTNTQAPQDFPPATPVGLRLFAGGIESNSYRITVLGEGERPRLSLGEESLSFTVQAGGPAQVAELAIEGYNGFCELVRFAVIGLPEGLRAAVPVGFPGRRVPVSVEALPHVRGSQEVTATLAAVSSLAENPAARLRITVLPSRGDIPLRVVSGGGRAGLFARFEMGGHLLHEARGGGPGRGIHFVVLNGDTGLLGPTRSFDTWASPRAAEDLADYLEALPAGTVVLAAIADEGTYRLTPRAREALRVRLRSHYSDALQYQDSWAIITRLGAPLPIAEAASRDGVAVVERVLTFPGG